jgi:hypothetical protein
MAPHDLLDGRRQDRGLPRKEARLSQRVSTLWQLAAVVTFRPCGVLRQPGSIDSAF